MTLRSDVDAILSDRIAPGARIGVAVSGGGDSTALLYLAAGWAARNDVKLRVATVDHGLRAAATDEARAVARQAADLGLAHHTLDWTTAPEGNVQAAARAARKTLLADWAKRYDLGAVLLGHTLDDQAETVLMRLARGSGVDGLAAMGLESRDHATRWIRPLLGAERSTLRAWLGAKGIDWIDDPSNEDPRFDRVRARQMAAHLAELGLTRDRLGALARHMARARAVLDREMAALATRAVRQHGGDLLLDRAAMMAALPETRARLLARAMMWVAASPYRPRFAALDPIADTLDTATLHGTILRPEGDHVRLMREARAVSDLSCAIDAVWDRRWRAKGPGGADLHLAALGQSGLAQCPDWRDSGFPAASLAASAAIWQGDTLIAAPLAGLENGWKTEIVPEFRDFRQSLPSY